MRLLTFCLFFHLMTSLSFANDRVIVVYPQEGQDLTNQRDLILKVRVNENLRQLTKAVMMRTENNRSVVVYEVSLDTRSRGLIDANMIPPGYFCEANYTIRLFDHQNRVLTSVLFKAGAGTCFSNNINNFVNLESRLPDIKNFRPSDQSSRDTCVAFASASALEAAYKRLKGKEILLSQNYIHHIIKSTWLTPNPLFLYENQSSFFGGNNVQDALKFLTKYRIPEYHHAPYQSQRYLSNILANLGIPDLVWNPNPLNNRITQDQVDALEYHDSHIPLNARLNAIYGVSEYKVHKNNGNVSITEIEKYLKANKEVIFSSRLLWMDLPHKAKTKHYSANGPGDNHLMLAVGFDKLDSSGPYMLVKNSWGDGVIRVHYNVLRNQKTISYGVIEKVTETFWVNPDRWIGRWEMKHDRWRGELIIRRIVEANNEKRRPPYRIGEYHHQNGKRYCAYGGFTNGSSTLLMKIDFDREIQDKKFNITYDSKAPSVNVIAKDVCPLEARGQDFRIDMASKMNTKGTGTTVWNNRTFPVEIWR